MGASTAIFQGLLWAAAGIAITRRRKIAYELVWVIVLLSAAGVIARGLIPIDIVYWLMGLVFAIWFRKYKQALL